MRELNVCLGGEQSGHIVFSEHSTTGDGIVAALKILEVMKRKKESLSSLSSILSPYPQVQINVEVKNKVPLENIEGYLELHKEKENDLKGEGRILIRYSGTEDLARVLVEGKDKNQITSIAHDFESFLKANLL
jgi:phosphoglucosamine mutase